VKQFPQRKRPRLAAVNYANSNEICSVTIAVRGRQPVFTDAAIASDTVDLIRSLAAAHGVRIFAYCVMPDHVHLVMSPSERCSVIMFVGQFKSLVIRSSWRYGVVGSFWQQGFWDHFLRAEEELRGAVDYVLANPVRAGLVDDGHLYPFSGSLEFALCAAGDKPPPYRLTHAWFRSVVAPSRRSGRRTSRRRD
jgi:REP element-mobilizing transposase RayT